MGSARTAARAPRSDAERNRQRLIAAAVLAMHREGPGVPMATIASDAGVGVGTLYRHFPTRDDLVEELTYRSMSLMLVRIEAAAQTPGTAVDTLRAFLTAVIGDRDDLVLRSTGGPEVASPRARTVQRRLHARIREVIRRGAEDGTIRRTTDVWDIAWLGSTLAQPGRPSPAWDAIAGRLLDTYLAGLGVA